MTDRPPIAFFDGTCGMCSASVRWILRHDQAGTLRFAPLQGETFAALEHTDKPTEPLGSGARPGGSMVVVDEGGVWTLSDSTLRLLHHMGQPYRTAAGIGRLVPRPIRNAAYRFMARHRYRIAGRVERCEVPTEADRARMLP